MLHEFAQHHSLNSQGTSAYRKDTYLYLPIIHYSLNSSKTIQMKMKASFKRISNTILKIQKEYKDIKKRS